MDREAENIRLILASGSPRRKEILEKMGLQFEVIPSSFEEILEDLSFSYEKIENLAKEKAFAVVDSLQIDAIVIGADTVVVLEGEILGKPEDNIHAKQMLKKLSGKVHSVVTSICVVDSKNKQSKICSTTSYVEFENLSDEKIEHYLTNYKPYDKAGSYGIQELPEGFVKEVKGSFENIIGLCPKALNELLKEFDIEDAE